MPVQCSSSALTGASGLITFKPAGGSACLKDYSDFVAGTATITVPLASDFRVGDKVKFMEEGSGSIDTAFTASTAGAETIYTVVKSDPGAIEVADGTGTVVQHAVMVALAPATPLALVTTSKLSWPNMRPSAQ